MIRKVVSSLLLIQLFLSTTPAVQGQTNEKIIVPSVDSAAPPDTSYIPPTVPLPDSDAIRQQVITGMDNFIRLQKENERKKRNQSYIRIGIGVAMLIVLIVGLMRKRKG